MGEGKKCTRHIYKLNITKYDLPLIIKLSKLREAFSFNDKRTKGVIN